MEYLLGIDIGTSGTKTVTFATAPALGAIIEVTYV